MEQLLLMGAFKNLKKQFRDEEYKELPSKLSPAQLMHLQCVQVIFDEALQKLRIALILPLVLSNPKVLQRYLGHTEFKDAYHVVRLYFAQIAKKERREQKAAQERKKRRRLYRAQPKPKEPKVEAKPKPKEPKVEPKNPKNLIEQCIRIKRELELREVHEQKRALEMPHLLKFHVELAPYRRKVYHYNRPFRRAFVRPPQQPPKQKQRQTGLRHHPELLPPEQLPKCPGICAAVDPEKDVKTPQKRSVQFRLPRKPKSAGATSSKPLAPRIIARIPHKRDYFVAHNRDVRQPEKLKQVMAKYTMPSWKLEAQRSSSLHTKEIIKELLMQEARKRKTLVDVQQDPDEQVAEAATEYQEEDEEDSYDSQDEAQQGQPRRKSKVLRDPKTGNKLKLPNLEAANKPLEALEEIDAFAHEDVIMSHEVHRVSIRTLRRATRDLVNSHKQVAIDEKQILEQIQEYQRQKGPREVEKKPMAALLQTPKENADPLTSRLIEYFFRNTGMLKYFPPWLDDLEQRDALCVETFELLNKMAERVLSRSASYVIGMEKVMNTMYKKNQDLEANVEKVEEKVKVRQARMRWVNAAKRSVCNQIERNLQLQYLMGDEMVREEMKKCRRGMRRIDEEHAHRREEYQAQLENMKLDMVKVARSNEDATMVVRDERNKLLIQLETLLRRREKLMIEKIRTKLDLKTQHDQASIEAHAVQEEYQDVSDEYRDVVLAYYERKRKIFIQQRAVRIIEKWVKICWEKRKQRIAMEKARLVMERQQAKAAAESAAEEKAQLEPKTSETSMPEMEEEPTPKAAKGKGKKGGAAKAKEPPAKPAKQPTKQTEVEQPPVAPEAEPSEGEARGTRDGSGIEEAEQPAPKTSGKRKGKVTMSVPEEENAEEKVAESDAAKGKGKGKGKKVKMAVEEDEEKDAVAAEAAASEPAKEKPKGKGKKAAKASDDGDSEATPEAGKEKTKSKGKKGAKARSSDDDFVTEARHSGELRRESVRPVTRTSVFNQLEVPQPQTKTKGGAKGKKRSSDEKPSRMSTVEGRASMAAVDTASGATKGKKAGKKGKKGAPDATKSEDVGARASTMGERKSLARKSTTDDLPRRSVVRKSARVTIVTDNVQRLSAFESRRSSDSITSWKY